MGYLQDSPAYWTQGESLDDPNERLNDRQAELSSGMIPGARRADDLLLS